MTKKKKKTTEPKTEPPPEPAPTPPSPPNPSESAFSLLERLGGIIDFFRNWIVRIYRLAILMAKGAFIVAERRRLFVKLGEEVYSKTARGEMRDKDLEPLVQQLDKLTKKVELEEILIRTIRFGKRPPRAKDNQEGKQP